MVISILCGGSGTRLWPISRALMPKQFVKIVDNESLFSQALKRNIKLLEEKDQLQIITNEQHYFLALDIAQAANIKIDSFVIETLSKNTAAALTISALLIAKDNPNETIVVLPSDHLIGDDAIYQRCIQKACLLAQDGYIVTFGITPNSPHTGYGYIQATQHDELQYNVVAFHEKPDLEQAQKYLQNGGFYWNSGMFCYQAKTLLEEMRMYEPEIYQACCNVVESSYKCADFIRLDKELSQKIPSQSIDYAIMEKTKKLVMVEANFAWNDIGSFDSLFEEFPKDSNLNASNTELIALQSSNNFVLSNKTVATIGLTDYIIVDTDDALLVAKKGQTQNVKEIVEILNKQGSYLTQNHNQTFRPWGSYRILQEHIGYKLKNIIVKPKHRLSLQKHYHRNEHWIVVSGSALVQIGEKEIFLQPNQSTYIPMGEIHRLSNPGTIDLVMIEVQVGEYLGEDDIVRLEDDYSRHT